MLLIRKEEGKENQTSTDCTFIHFILAISCRNLDVCLEVQPSLSAKHLLSLSCRSRRWIQMRPLAAMLASSPLSPSFPLCRSHSLSLPLSAILMLNSYSLAGRCRNNHQAQHSFSMPGRKWPGQLLAIQPETLFGWPTLWHNLLSTVTLRLLFPFHYPFLLPDFKPTYLIQQKFPLKLKYFIRLTWNKGENNLCWCQKKKKKKGLIHLHKM